MTLANKLSAQQEAVNRVELAVRAERMAAAEHRSREQEVLDAVRQARQVNVKMTDLIGLTKESRSGLYAKLKSQSEDEDLPQ